MSLTLLTAVEAANQMVMTVPMSGAWVPWPGSNPEPAFIGNLRTNLDSNQPIKDIFKTIGVIIMVIWVGYIGAKVALPGKGGGARSIQWVGVIIGMLVAGICLNLEALPNILSVVLLAGASLLDWLGIG